MIRNSGPTMRSCPTRRKSPRSSRSSADGSGDSFRAIYSRPHSKAPDAFLQKRMERTPDPAQRQIRLHQRTERTIRTTVATEFSEKVARARVPQGAWIDLLAHAVLEDRSWTIDEVLLRHGYSGSRDVLQRGRHRIARALIEKMSDAEKRSFVLDALISGWNSPQTSEGKRAVF